jgi:Brp/Blh family beta-carotene 15,15'-monooxygenase
MTVRNRNIYFAVVASSLLLSLIAFLFPAWIASVQWYLIVAVMVLIGIPHGATDQLIYDQLTKEKKKIRNTPVFLAGYLSVIALYALIWLLSAQLALFIFLIISAYHFGQSNMDHVHFNNTSLLRSLSYISSGVYVIFVPILLKYQEAVPILQNILGSAPLSTTDISVVRWPVILGLVVLNIMLSSWFLFRQNIDYSAWKKDLLNIFVLFCVFYSMPMMLAFIIYFGIWHALSSTLMQIEKMRELHKKFNWLDFYRKALPYTMLALIGIVAILLLSQQPDVVNAYAGLFFIILSTLTLPHMLLMDRFYNLSA